MSTLISMIKGINTGVGMFGPKVAAVGILLSIAGNVLQGKFEEISSTDIELALVALGLWGARANKVSSEKAGAV